jgi:hypothetical protein
MSYYSKKRRLGIGVYQMGKIRQEGLFRAILGQIEAPVFRTPS